MRFVQHGVAVLAAALVCVAGCQTSGSKSRMDGNGSRIGARDLRADHAVCPTRPEKLDPQAIRIIWAGENSLAIDGERQLSGRRALIRYLSHEGKARLGHGILLIAAKGSPGFDPLDVLSEFCLKRNVNLYCVALTSPEPAEPAVPDAAVVTDWRGELPNEVFHVIQAGWHASGGVRQASADPEVLVRPAAW